MAACALHNSSRMEMLSVDSTRVAAPLHLHGIVMERLNWTTPVTRDTGIVASALPNGILMLGDVANLSLPIPADIVSAFVAIGNPLSIGDAFRVYFQTMGGGVAHMFAFPIGYPITDKQNIGSTIIGTVGTNSSGFLIFVYTALNSFDVYMKLGSI